MCSELFFEKEIKIKTKCIFDCYKIKQAKCMKKTKLLTASLFIIVLSSFTTLQAKTNMENPKTSIKEENVRYMLDTLHMKGFVAYNSSTVNKRPIVLIIPEWWGINDYALSRAKQLAELGYLAMAIDVYGNGTIAEDPTTAGQMAGPFYQNPQLAKARFEAALAKIKTYAMADTTKIAIIGYCFGGGMALNIARLGENLRGVVSFHGSLMGVPVDKKTLKADILVCHGEDDKFVKAQEVASFKKSLDEIGVKYTFKSYPNATHAFTNPNATEKGKKYNMPIAYNATADLASFNQMKLFLTKIFK